jgi:hypothetical protein
VAFSFGSYVQATSLNGEALYTLTLPLIVMGTLWISRRPSLIGGAMVGAVHGAAMLIRPEHALLLVMTLGLVAWKRRADFANWRLAAPPRAGVCVGSVVAAAVCVCLPWSVLTARATARFNTVTATIDYDRAQPPWTAEARAVLDGVPAFSRGDNFEYLSFLAQQARQPQITADAVREYFQREFAYLPEPIREWNLVSGQGPLSFALANHAKATGGFSKAGLDARFGPDPALSFGLPSHLYLYNHGYAAGWKWIRENPAAWVRLAGKKLAIFGEGATQGLTAWNAPLGRTGVRRAVDSFTAAAPGWVSLVWRGLLAVVAVAGLVVAVRGRVATVWLLIIAYKVVVTVAFYGYARQAESILPAFAVVLSLGVDVVLGGVVSAAGHRVGWKQRAAAVWAVLAVALLGADVWAWRRPVTMAPSGDFTPATRWGGGAFESPSDIGLGPR